MSKATRVVVDGVNYPLDDTTAVDFSEAQSLNTAEKQQARTNIGAGSAADVTSIQTAIGTVPAGSNLQGEVDDLKNGAVRFDGSQSLSAAQQTTARGNIGAGSASDVSDLKSALKQVNTYELLKKTISGGAVFPFEITAGTKYVVTNLSNDATVFVRTCTSDGTAIENIGSTTAYMTPTEFVAGLNASYVRVYSNSNNVTVSIQANGELLNDIDDSISNLTSEIEDINSKINPLFLGVREYKLPSDFDMQSPIKIYTDGNNFMTDFDASDHKNVGGNTWYVAPTTAAGNTGTTRNSPLPFQAAYNSASSGDTIILLEGTYSRSSGGGYVFSNPIKKSLNIIAEGNGALFLDGNIVSFSKTNGYTNVYNGSRSLTSRVIDISIKGKYIPYVLVDSISAVDALAGSYYVDGSTVYVHSLDHGNPSSRVVCCINYEKALDISNADQNLKVYVENITLVGKYTGILIDKESASNTLNVCFNNVSTILCGNENGGANAFRVYGGNVIFNKCKSLSSYRDGFNYNGVNTASTPCDCNCVEIDCIGAGSGHEASQENMNGSTCHIGAKVIRVNGKYYDCLGPSVADVQQDTQSVNLGCLAYSPYCTSANSINFASSDGGSEMWLDGCLAVGGVNDLYCASGSSMYINNTAYKTKLINGTFDEERTKDVTEMLLLKGTVNN